MMAELIETAGRALVALTMVLGVAVASYRFGRHLVGSTPVLFRLMTTALVGCFLATAGFFLLLPLGLFRWWAGCVACLCLGIIALAWPATGSSLKRQLARDSRALRRLSRSKLPGRWRVITLCFALFAAIIVARSLIVPPLGWDTLTYHGPRSILWVQTGQFTFEEAPGTWDLYRHFLSGVEVLVAWAMLPMHSDLLAGAAGGAQWLVLAVAVAALSRELGLKGPDALCVVVGAMFIPVIQLLAGSGYSEPGLYFYATSGMAAAIRFQKVPSWPSLLIAGAALGLAAGAKPQGPAYAAVTALFVLIVIAKTNKSRKGAVAWSAAFLGLVALPVLPWMVASYWDTGYLFAPFPMEIGGWVLGEGSVAMRWFQVRPDVVPYSHQEWGAIRKIFETPGQFPETVGLLYLVPLALLPAGVIAGLQRRPWPVILLLAVITAVLGIHFSPAMSLVRIGWPYSSSRQVAFAVILALPLVMMAGRAAPRFGALCRAITVGAAGYYAFAYSRFGWAGFEYVDIAVVLAAVGWGAWLVWKARQRSTRFAFSVAVLATIVGLCV